MACKHFYLVNTITVTATNVVLAFTETATVEDEEKICFKLNENIPTASQALPVQIVVNGANTPLWDKYGNLLTGEKLRKCRCYCGYYGETSPHVILPKVPMTCNGACGNVI